MPRRVAIVGAGMTPFAEHFDLGIKDLVPMAYAEAVAQRRQGHRTKSEIEAAWFGELSTTDGFPSGILADTLDLTDIPVTRVENACATGNDAIRNGTLAIASGLYDVVLVRRRRQGARDVHQHDVLGLGGHDPGQRLGLSTGPGRAGQLRLACHAVICMSRRRPGSTWPWWR